MSRSVPTGGGSCTDRGKFLMMDIETAKKIELARRRKIRIQQARQQGNDLTRNIRKKFKVEVSKENTKENNDNPISEKENEDPISVKEKENPTSEMEKREVFSELGHIDVGSGHHQASVQINYEALLKEKELLREEIAKARGALAEERRKTEKYLLREKSSLVAERHRLNKEVEDVRAKLIAGLPKVVGLKGKQQPTVTKYDIPEKKSLKNSLKPQVADEQAESYSNQRLKESGGSQTEDREDDCDDSESDTPPATVSKEPLCHKVRTYDHKTATSKECAAPSYKVVFHPQSEGLNDMCEVIANEEAVIAEKERKDLFAQRECLARGRKALLKERDMKEADDIIKEIDEIEKRRRIQDTLTSAHKNHVHARQGKRVVFSDMITFEDGPGDGSFDQSDEIISEEHLSKYGKNIRGINRKKDSDISLKLDLSTCSKEDTEEILEELLAKLNEKRSKQEKPQESGLILPDNQDDEIPLWVKQKLVDISEEKDASHEITTEEEEIVKNNCESNEKQRRTSGSNSKDQSVSEEQSSEVSEKVDVDGAGKMHTIPVVKNRIIFDEGITLHNHSVDSTPQNGDRDVSEQDSRAKEITSSTTESSHSDNTMHSSLTYEGVKVVVRVSEINKRIKVSPKKAMPKEMFTPVQQEEESLLESASKKSKLLLEGTSSSTSYRSLPLDLSPKYHSLFQSVLSQIMNKKTTNIPLTNYMKQVLGMTRESIDALPISSVSDVSIGSSVFEPIDHLKKDISCQAEESGGEGAVKFTELAQEYAKRVEDLAGVLDTLNLHPSQAQQPADDTSYIHLPSESFNDLPTSINPHPSFFTSLQPTISKINRKLPETIPNGLSIIHEADTVHETDRPISPISFVTEVSSIEGSPKKKDMTCSSSSLSLLNSRDFSSFYESSSDNIEEVFQSLGIAWALPTVRKVRQSRKLSSSSSSGRYHYSHSTPLVLSPKISPAKTSSTISQKRISKSRGLFVQTTSGFTPVPTQAISIDEQTAPKMLGDVDSLTPPSYSLVMPKLTELTGQQK